MKHRGSYLHLLNQSDSHETMANVYSIGGLSGLCSNIVIAWNKGGTILVTNSDYMTICCFNFQEKTSKHIQNKYVGAAPLHLSLHLPEVQHQVETRAQAYHYSRILWLKQE
jgi:hypothetical protein